MPDREAIRQLVASAVTEVFASEAEKLRNEVIRCVQEQLQPAIAASPGRDVAAQLRSALARVEAAVSQTDILNALLDGVAGFCARSALFVVRGAMAMGWQAHGFAPDVSIREIRLDLNAGLAGRAARQKLVLSGPVAELNPRFISAAGAPANGACTVFPLTIRDNVVCLVYADAGTDSSAELDSAALELLVHATGTWLELLALRKNAGIAPPANAAVPSSAPAPVRTEPPSREVAPSAAASVPAVSVTAPPPASSSPAPSSDDDELHRKAKRFARLLVEELKLYNAAKVAEGKLNRNLYDVLREDIDKSRAAYDKRYAQTPVSVADYFTNELIRGLADGNPALLGSSFSG